MVGYGHWKSGSKALSGVDPTAAGEFAEKKKEKANPDAKTIKDSFTVFRGRKLAMENLKKSIQTVRSPRSFFRCHEFDWGTFRPTLSVTDEDVPYPQLVEPQPSRTSTT
jgi:hypothetical protein